MLQGKLEEMEGKQEVNIEDFSELVEPELGSEETPYDAVFYLETLLKLLR